MASLQPKQGKEDSANTNGVLGKRKKSRKTKGSYLSKWLDKSMQHIQGSSPSMDTYEPNFRHPISHFPPNYDPYQCNIYGTPEPMSLPTLPTYCNTSMASFYAPECHYQNKSIQVQRPRHRRRSDNKPEEVPITPTSTHYLQPKTFTDSQDYTSLPPIVTSAGDTTSNSDMNANQEENGNRRFSDPCVQSLPDVAKPANGDVESESEDSSGSASQVDGRLLTCLVDQITSLKMANERLNRELHETKVELSSYRQNSVWQKGAGAALNGNGLIHGQYSPGFVTDLVREIRDAARVREEAMYNRMRAMMLDRNDMGLTSTESKLSEKTIEDIKSSLRGAEADKRRMMDRILRLEEEIRSLKLNNGLEPSENRLTNGYADSEADKARLRKELADMKKAKQQAEEHALKLERLVTQLKSKCNGLQLSPSGPESLPSESDHDPNRARRTSVNSTSNSTVVFGPVTDL